MATSVANAPKAKQSIKSKVESLLAGYDDHDVKNQTKPVEQTNVEQTNVEQTNMPTSKEAPAKKSAKTATAEAQAEIKRRGRKPKAETQDVVAEAPKRGRKPKAETPEVTAEAPKRGRKPKAQAEAQVAEPQAETKRRGRPAATKTSEPVAQAETKRTRRTKAEMEAARATQQEEAPKRRGRKPAISQVEQGVLALEQADPTTAEQPAKRRGRPAKNVEAIAPVQAEEPKRRGRPAKAAVEQDVTDYSDAQLDPTSDDDIAQIERTRDYEQFKLSDENRNIDIAHVRNLVESIREKNLLASYPIIVNSNYEVMDGQHRLEAAKLLDKPVYFKVDDNFKPENIARINTVSKKWALEAYLKHYMAKGNKQYEMLNNFATEFAVNIYSAIGLLSGRTAQPNNDLVTKFKNGEFTVKDESGAIQVMKIRNDFSEYGGDFYKSKTFLNAISRLAKSPLYDHTKMMEKLSKQPRSFVKCNTVDQYLEMLSEIYNYHSRKAVDFTEIVVE